MSYPAKPMVSVHYIRQIAEEVRRRGVSVGQWLEMSGLAADQLDDPAVTLDYPAFRQLIVKALELTGEAALGLFIGERLVASTHGIVGYAALSSGTIRQALELLERFAGLRITLLTFSYKLYRGDVRVCFEEAYPVEEIQRPLLEAVVLSVKNVLDTITLGTCPIREVSFPFKTPAYASLARDMFRADVRYGQSWTGFAFPKELLDAPLKLADLEAFRQAELICQQELSKLSNEPSIAVRVRRLLLEKQNGFPSLPTVARQFHQTPRTLHRRLEAEGTSFRDVLAEVRHTLAVEHLKSGQSTIEEIAFLLGYSDLANFRRAFKRWEGTTPSAFRRRFTKS